jgi:hypothetical protein
MSTPKPEAAKPEAAKPEAVEPEVTKPEAVKPEAPKPGRQGADRRINAGLNVALQVLLAAAVLVMANYIAMRHYKQFDWTRGHVYTLSEQTENVLRSLQRPVEIIVMMSRGDEMFQSAQRMFDKYAEVGGDRLRIRYIDPDWNRAEFEHVVEQYPIATGVTEDEQVVYEQVIVVVAGENNRFVTPSEDFVSQDAQGMMEFGAQPTFSQPRAELAMTSAIYRVVAGHRRVVCVSSGHGEWQVQGGGERSMGYMNDQLERFEVELRPVTVSVERPPELGECDAVVVAGPRRPFMPEEARILEQYVLEHGGDLMLFLDPIVERERFVPTGLEDLARRLGVEVESDEVIDPRATAQFCGGGHPSAFIAASQDRHVCVVRARSVEVVEGREGAPFLETISDEAYGEVNPGQLVEPVRDDADRAGPLALGVAIEQDNEAARTARIERNRAEIEAELPESARRGSLVIVVGDSDVLDQNHTRNPMLGNFALTAGLFNSVADNTVLVAQPPRDVERAQLTLTDSQMYSTFMLFVIVLPLMGIVAGVIMWWTRRR